MTLKSGILSGLSGLVMVAGAGAVSGQEWQTISRNDERVYLVDVGNMSQIDDVTVIMVARVSRKPASATNYSYTADEYSYRCRTNEVRPGASIEYGEDGTETNRFEDGGEWESVRPDTLDAFVKQVACDGDRANPPFWPSIRAFMEAGRGN